MSGRSSNKNDEIRSFLDYCTWSCSLLSFFITENLFCLPSVWDFTISSLSFRRPYSLSPNWGHRMHFTLHHVSSDEECCVMWNPREFIARALWWVTRNQFDSVSLFIAHPSRVWAISLNRPFSFFLLVHSAKRCNNCILWHRLMSRRPDDDCSCCTALQSRRARKSSFERFELLTLSVQCAIKTSAAEGNEPMQWRSLMEHIFNLNCVLVLHIGDGDTLR